MAHWDQYEGRTPLEFREGTYDLYDLKQEDLLFKGNPGSGVWVDIDSPLDRYRDDRPEWYAYVWGFKDAADRLVEDLIVERDESSLHSRFLGNPILALYRHSVELAIKSILITGGAARTPEVLKSHNLDWLWMKAVDAMKVEAPDIVKDGYLKKAGELIAELNEADANSENFRYGVDKKLSPYERRVENVDVLNLRRVMSKLAAALEGCDTWLHETMQARWELEAEMRQEYYEDMRQYLP